MPAAFSGSRVAPLLRNWSVAEQAAIRSGFPFSVNAPASFTFNGGGLIRDNRADLIDPALAEKGQGTVAGGESLLNANAFQAPPAGVVATPAATLSAGRACSISMLLWGGRFKRPGWVSRSGLRCAPMSSIC